LRPIDAFAAGTAPDPAGELTALPQLDLGEGNGGVEKERAIDGNGTELVEEEEKKGAGEGRNFRFALLSYNKSYD